MTHIPGHHGRGMEAAGPLVKPGDGYQERGATKSVMDPTEAHFIVSERQRYQRYLMSERERAIDLGLVHLTPAMEEALAKVDRDNN